LISLVLHGSAWCCMDQPGAAIDQPGAAIDQPGAALMSALVSRQTRAQLRYQPGGKQPVGSRRE
jgi:hypothetical protein